MHDDQVDIDVELVQRLIEKQFPQWADLPLEYFDSGGTVNAIYRLGDDMYVRLPLREAWAWGLKTEAKWLPRLAPHLPLPIPKVLAHGEPDEGYPLAWSVYRWIDGEPWRPDRVRDMNEAAEDLARFISAMQRIDPTDGKVPRGSQGLPLRSQDGWVRMTAESARDTIDADALLAAWDEALELPDFAGTPVWVHSDLLPGNVLIQGGRVNAVIDFSGAHVGDPALDISAAWKLLKGAASREVFRAALDVDDATWSRARGWAMPSVGALHYYRRTNPAMVAFGLHTITQVLLDL
ncbi:MAG: aminoglycoside phosphotransferase family protein [Actinomycetota bacterium]